MTYTVVGEQMGPSDAAGATVVDNAPGRHDDYAGAQFAGGATGNASGRQHHEPVTILEGGGAPAYTISDAYRAADGRSEVNTATVTAAYGVTDLTPGNNSDGYGHGRPDGRFEHHQDGRQQITRRRAPQVVVVSNGGPKMQWSYGRGQCTGGDDDHGLDAAFAGGATGTRVAAAHESVSLSNYL